MCLTSNSFIRKVVKEPIECYKVLCFWYDLNDGYYSPSYRKRYEIGKTYHEEEFTYTLDGCNFCADEGYNHGKHFLYHHGFHLCLTNEDAINYLKSITAATIEAGCKEELIQLERIVVVKCSVPFGGSYVMGEDNMYHIPGLVCSDVKIEEIVNTFTLDGNFKLAEQQNSNSII